MTETESIESEIRERGFTEEDHSRAWLGFWVSIWIGTIAAGAIAGIVMGSIYSVMANEPWSVDKSLYLVLSFFILGILMSAVVGFAILVLASVYVWLFKSYQNLLELAAIVGGLTAFFCMPLFLPVTGPLGIFGAWYAAKRYLRTDAALPLVLFGRLREEKRLELYDRRKIRSH